MYRKICMMLAALALSTGVTFAQDEVPAGDNAPGDSEATTPSGELEETVAGLGERTTLLEALVDQLRSIKISGYVQAEWQHFDQKTSLGGRALYSDATKNLFTIRRGRIKFQHKLGDLMSYTLYPDITERGVVLKEAFLELNLLPEDALNFDIGAFNRPNYEVELSSSARESIERSQVVRAFYPDERDLGVMLSTRKMLFDGFDPKLQLGLFNGVGLVKETDAYKDFIGRLVLPLPFGSESPVQMDLGASIYLGGAPQTTDSLVKAVDGTMKTVANDELNGGFGNKKNFNVETQIYLDLLPFGGTILKGEFLTGTRPFAGAAAVAASIGIGKDSAGRDIPRVVPGTPAKPMTIRNQAGYYAYFIQNVAGWLQLVAKYDYFDRNTDLSGTDAKTLDDAASSVLGFGVNLFYQNLRVTLFYEHPTFAADENALRDKTGTITSTEDVKDDKATIRFQYKF